MKFMPWKKDYSVHVTIIDKQHRHLNEIINQLYDETYKNNYSEVKKLIKSFMKDLKEHFDTEEELMTSHNDPTYFSHKLEHDRVIRKYTNFFDSISKQRKPKLDISFFESYKRWFENHHYFKDRKLSVYSKKKK